MYAKCQAQKIRWMACAFEGLFGALYSRPHASWTIYWVRILGVGGDKGCP